MLRFNSGTYLAVVRPYNTLAMTSQKQRGELTGLLA